MSLRGRKKLDSNSDNGRPGNGGTGREAMSPLDCRLAARITCTSGDLLLFHSLPLRPRIASVWLRFWQARAAPSFLFLSVRLSICAGRVVGGTHLNISRFVFKRIAFIWDGPTHRPPPVHLATIVFFIYAYTISSRSSSRPERNVSLSLLLLLLLF